MYQTAQSISNFAPERSDPVVIKTSLYEMIEAVSEEVNSAEEQFVPLIVSHILESCRLVISQRPVLRVLRN